MYKHIKTCYLSNTKLASKHIIFFISRNINKKELNFGIKMIENDTINIEIIGCIEETIDKLHISGQIMPLTYEMKKNAKAVS